MQLRIAQRADQATGDAPSRSGAHHKGVLERLGGSHPLGRIESERPLEEVCEEADLARLGGGKLGAARE